MVGRFQLVETAGSLVRGVSGSASPDWFGVLRTVMMVLGGIVVIAIVLVVSVAIISGVLGMIGRLRKRSK
jgi:amino acid transporter